MKSKNKKGLKERDSTLNRNTNAKNGGEHVRDMVPARDTEEGRSELRPVTKSKPQHKVPSVHR